MNLTLKQKQQLITIYPELREWLMSRESGNSIADALAAEVLKKIEMVKGEKGDKGDKGDTPVKGKDYFTDNEIKIIIAHILKEATPVKGKHYTDGSDYVLTAKDKQEIARSIDVPVVEKIVEKTEVVKEVLLKDLDVSMVKGAVTKKDLESNNKKILDGMALVDGRIKAIDQRWKGGGLSKVTTDSTLTGTGTPSSPLSVVGGGFNIETPTGAVNATNRTFTVTNTPKAVIIDGMFLVSGFGYTYVAGTITTDATNPPVNFIRSIY